MSLIHILLFSASPLILSCCILQLTPVHCAGNAAWPWQQSLVLSCRSPAWDLLSGCSQLDGVGLVHRQTQLLRLRLCCTHRAPGGLLSSARLQDGLLTSRQGCWFTRTASLGSRQLADRFLFLHLITVWDKICRQNHCWFYTWSCCTPLFVSPWDRRGIPYTTLRRTILCSPNSL